ncbi:MAG: DMT family transporter [Burkholderiales bacterium]|nr:DMT family transporter [Burkholderiales bacterium]
MSPPAERKPVDALAFGVMVLLTLTWGFQQVTIKIAAPGVSTVMQAGIRSIAATLLLLVWARLRGIPLFERDRTFWPGVIAGALFAAEFFFIYLGLNYTAASRMVVFIYLAPILTALGLAVYVPGERLTPRQWLGVCVSFAGVALAFGEGFVAARGETWAGDLMGMIAALLWAATTVLIRATRLSNAPAAKTLFYQLAVSALTLPVASVAIGEPGIVSLTPIVLASLAFQSVVVAFATYLAWFWLLTKYYAAPLSVFAFLSPLFGVLFGVLLLAEPFTPLFGAAAAAVLAGIALVNFRGK